MSLAIPDRFKSLADDATYLQSIIVPVENALHKIDELYSEIKSSRRGGFLLLRGDSGAGKTTFLRTLHLFREGVYTEVVPGSCDLRRALAQVEPAKSRLRIIVLEGREALSDTTPQEIEAALHAINGFIRDSKRGRNTIVVWPCNTDDMQARLVTVAEKIGAESLLGVAEPAYRFSGPDKQQYKRIAEATVATLNNGMTLAELGLTEDEVKNIIEKSQTTGRMLSLVRNAAIAKQKEINTLIKKGPVSALVYCCCRKRSAWRSGKPDTWWVFSCGY